jgi:uncharacterized protein
LELVGRLARPEYGAVIERAVTVAVEAFDWNCQQHMIPRFPASELKPVLAGMRQRIRDAKLIRAGQGGLARWLGRLTG